MFALITLLLISVNSGRNISWFKQTAYHNDNIAKLENSWTECEHWSDTYNNIGGELSIQLDDFGIPTTIAVNSSRRFNYTASCISLNVPLDWDDQQLDKTINYTISRIYTRNDIKNVAGNGAFCGRAGRPQGSDRVGARCRRAQESMVSRVRSTVWASTQRVQLEG